MPEYQYQEYAGLPRLDEVLAKRAGQNPEMVLKKYVEREKRRKNHACLSHDEMWHFFLGEGAEKIREQIFSIIGDCSSCQEDLNLLIYLGSVM